MCRNSSAFILSLLFTLLAISLVSPLYLIKNASASLDNALNSEVRIVESSTKNDKPGQQDNGIQASGHFANNQIQNGSVTCQSTICYKILDQPLPSQYELLR